jgi:hypothetical protein
LWQFLPSISSVAGAQMKSLYDLLGARENDDADALKKAFRRAIKANHPDFHPGNPDAVERLREIIAANARLRDPKERATYDRLLQLERERFQATPMLKRQQRSSTLAGQLLRLKRMRVTAAVAAGGVLISGYGLFAPMHTTDEHVAATGAMVERDRQTATVVAAAGENENPPTAAAKVDAAKGNVDNAGKPVGSTGGKLMAPADGLDQGEPRDKDDGTEVPNGASKPRTDEHDDAQSPIGANKPNADKHEDAKALNEANELSDDAAAIMRFVMQRLRHGSDAQATAGRELALGPPATDAHDDAQIPIGANKPNADKQEDAKALNETNELSDDAAAIVRFVMQRFRRGGDDQAMAGRDLAPGPPTNNAKFYQEIARNIDQIATSIGTGQEPMTRSSDQAATRIDQAPSAKATSITVESQGDPASSQPTARLNIKPTEAKLPQTLSERGKQPSTASGHDTSCFPSASAVVQQHRAAWPSWTLRAPGHEGTKCWYAATRTRAREGKEETAGTRENGLFTPFAPRGPAERWDGGLP